MREKKYLVWRDRNVNSFNCGISCTPGAAHLLHSNLSKESFWLHHAMGVLDSTRTKGVWPKWRDGWGGVGGLIHRVKWNWSNLLRWWPHSQDRNGVVSGTDCPWVGHTKLQRTPAATQRTSVERDLPIAVHKLPILCEGEGGSVKHRKPVVETYIWLRDFSKYSTYFVYLWLSRFCFRFEINKNLGND